VTAPAAARVADSALAWTYAHRSHFRLPADVLAPHTDVNTTLKPFGELSQLCASIARTGGGKRSRTAAELVGSAWRDADGGALLLELLRAEPFATYPLEIYAAFASHGLRHDGVEEFAAVLTASRGWRGTEQEPTRRLGVLHTEARMGLEPHAAPEAVLRTTWLGALPEPWTFERSAGYALTHTVFHLTDWGGAPQGMPRDVAEYLTAWLPAWLDSCLEGGLWDLACELLAVGASLPEPPDRASAEEAWSRIAAVQDPSGALPETGADARGHPVRRTFATCYHSTLVAAFAAALTDARLRGDAPAGPADEGRT